MLSDHDVLKNIVIYPVSRLRGGAQRRGVSSSSHPKYFKEALKTGIMN